MANLFINSGRNSPFITIIRRLSSFNNNRTKFGIVSIMHNDDLNIWSENNWSEFAKQFNKPVDFPLPGQVGILFDSELKKKFLEKIKPTGDSNQKSHTGFGDLKLINENLDVLLNSPLPHENQAIKLREACGALNIHNKMENRTNNETSKINNLFELKAYKCPLSLVQDFQNYFRLKSISDAQQLTLITISFKTKNDMATWNCDVDEERESLMKQFVETCEELCLKLEKEGYWADYIDPSSGQPHNSPYSHATFYETDERYRSLGFEIVDYGCCKVISHHKWGTKSYVGSLLTTAPTNGKLVKDITTC